MEHLSAETLARLVDEAASDVEQGHLAECAECARELDAFRAQREALADLADIRPPRGVWNTLEARLASEGLVRRGPALRLGSARTRAWTGAAAALVLFVGGTGVGVALARRPGLGLGGGGGDGGASPFALASRATSVEEAAAAVKVAERQWMDAFVRYRQMLDAENGEATFGDPENRLAALEYLTAAAQAAMRAAPTDPFLNGLLASTLAERQAAQRETVRRASQGASWY